MGEKKMKRSQGSETDSSSSQNNLASCQISIATSLANLAPPSVIPDTCLQ